MRTSYLKCFLAIVASLGTLLHSGQAELTLEVLKEREQQMRATVRSAHPATVGIEFPQSAGAGSGVLVSEDGLVLTAAHVTGESGRDVTIILAGGERLPGKTLGAFRSLDASMIQITAENRKFPTVPLGESAALEIGQWCLAIGHPGGFHRERPAPVRLGRILNKNAHGFLLTDSTLVGGDSGGPLLDLQGRLIGIHSSIGNDLAENRHVPIDVFRQHWDSMKSGRVEGELLGWIRGNSAFLGVVLETEGAPETGALIRQVVPGSPAEEAGLDAGDLVMRIDGEELASGLELIKIIRDKDPGDSLTLQIATPGAEPRELTVELKSYREFRDELEGLRDQTEDEPRAPGFLGVLLSREGRSVVVDQLVEGSPAEEAGLKEGDAVLQYDDHPMRELDDFIRYVGRKSPGDSLRLLIERDDDLKRLTATLGQRPE